MSLPVIEVVGLGKKFVIDHKQTQRKDTFRDVITDNATKLLATSKRIITSDRKRKIYPPKEDFWALKDVSFKVEKGDRIGIIGRNGAGKSTLLKLLSRVTEPTTGSITIRGKVASLLEVGTGFHPELSGRENIFLNGAILGMSRTQIRKKFDEIVDFAEIEKFLDTPVKRYSSGMYVRLAFAVAAHLDAELLVLDEVIAVGDAQFQKKCLNKVLEVNDTQGRTILFVSHNMAALKSLCSKGILLDNGQVQTQGEIADVIGSYIQGSIESPGCTFRNFKIKDKTGWQIIKAELLVNNVNTSNYFNGQDFKIIIECIGKIKDKISLEVIIKDKENVPILFLPCGLQFEENFDVSPGNKLFGINISLPFMAEGDYSIDLILAHAGARIIDIQETCLSFRVDSNYNKSTAWNFTQKNGQGSILLQGTSYCVK